MENVALVTGGSSGLGFEIAKLLCSRGIAVNIVGRNQSKLHSAKTFLEEHNGNNVPVNEYRANVGSEEEVQRLFDQLREKGRMPTIVFNVAGSGSFGDPKTLTMPQIKKVLEANLVGLMLVSSYSLRFMNQRSGGKIVNIMSTAALTARPNESAYCAAKWGARGYTEAIKAATKGTNVSIISVFPGGMATPFWSPECGMQPDTSKFMDPEDVARRIVDEVLQKDSSIVSDITINRSEGEAK